MANIESNSALVYADSGVSPYGIAKGIVNGMIQRAVDYVDRRVNSVYKVVYDSIYHGGDEIEKSPFLAPTALRHNSYAVVFNSSSEPLENEVASVLAASEPLFAPIPTSLSNASSQTGNAQGKSSSLEFSSSLNLAQEAGLKASNATSNRQDNLLIAVADSPKAVESQSSESADDQEIHHPIDLDYKYQPARFSQGAIVELEEAEEEVEVAHIHHPVVAIGPSNSRYYVNAGIVALGVAAGALVNNLGLEYDELVSKIKNNKDGIFNLLLYNLLLKLFKGNYKYVNSYLQQLAALGTFAAFGIISEAMTKGEAFGPTALVTSIISISLLLKGPLYSIAGKKTYSGPLVEEQYVRPEHRKYSKNALKTLSVALPTLHAISTQFVDQESLYGLLELFAIDGGEARILKALLKEKIERHPQRLLLLLGFSVISTLIVGAIAGDIPKAMSWPLFYQASNALYAFLRTKGKSFTEHPHVEPLNAHIYSSIGLGALNSAVFSSLFKANDALIESTFLKTALVVKQLHLGYEIQSKAAKHESTLGRIAGIVTSIGAAAITDTVLNAIWPNEDSTWTAYLATGIACCYGAAYLGKWVRNYIFGRN